MTDLTDIEDAIYSTQDIADAIKISLYTFGDKDENDLNVPKALLTITDAINNLTKAIKELKLK